MAIPYSKFRTEPRVPLLMAVPLPAPLVLHTELCNACSLACSFCPESYDDFFQKNGKSRMMSKNEFSLVLTEVEGLLAGGKIKHWDMHQMGEPLLNPILPWAISEIKRRNLAERVVLTTNGTLLDERRATEILDSGLDNLRVSIYGLDQEEFERNTQRKIRWDKVRDNVARFHALRNVRGQTTPFMTCKMIEGDKLRFGSGKFEAIYGGICDETWVEPLCDWDSSRKLAGVPEGWTDKSEWFAGDRKCCPSPFYTMVINADGRVTACCVDWAKGTEYGNVFETPLIDIWRGARLREFQRMHVDGRRGEHGTCGPCKNADQYQDSLSDLTLAEFDARGKDHWKE